MAWFAWVTLLGTGDELPGNLEQMVQISEISERTRRGSQIHMAGGGAPIEITTPMNEVRAKLKADRWF